MLEESGEDTWKDLYEKVVEGAINGNPLGFNDEGEILEGGLEKEDGDCFDRKELLVMLGALADDVTRKKNAEDINDVEHALTGKGDYDVDISDIRTRLLDEGYLRNEGGKYNRDYALPESWPEE